MEIRSKVTWKTGQVYDFIFRDSDPLDNVEDVTIHGVNAFCFYKGQLIIVNHPIGGWLPPGGGINKGETYQEATVREVREETNMKVLHQELIGYVDVNQPHGIRRRVRTFCIVEPYGPFVTDPDGDIQEIKLIDPKDYKQWEDAIYPYGGPDNYLQYLLDSGKLK